MEKNVRKGNGQIGITVKHDLSEDLSGLDTKLVGDGGIFCEITPTTGGLPGSCGGCGTEKFYATWNNKRYLFERAMAGASYSLRFERADGTPVPDELAEAVEKAVTEYSLEEQPAKQT